MDGARLNDKFQIYSICYIGHFSFSDNSSRAVIIFPFQVVLIRSRSFSRPPVACAATRHWEFGFIHANMVPGASTSEVVITSDSCRSWHNGAGPSGIIHHSRVFASASRSPNSCGLPTVAINVSDRVQELANGIVNRSDASFDAAEPVAELAKKHFLERGLTHFAFVGVDDVVWSERRKRHFGISWRRPVSNCMSTASLQRNTT